MKKQFIKSELNKLLSAVLDINFQNKAKVNIYINNNSVYIYEIVDDVFIYNRTAYYDTFLYNYRNEDVVPFIELLTDLKTHYEKLKQHSN